jgi:DNA-binding response OmpR family regulator
MDRSNKKRILIAEDESPMAKALETQMISAGYEVKAVSNGEEAILAVEKESFDLMILDLVMPIKDGFEVLREIKEKGISIQVIVFSSLAREENIKKAKEFGARDFFVKSDTSLSDLAEHVKKII